MAQVEKHAVLIVVGETGSGKSTQLPQFILGAGLAGDAQVAITQPRRVATTTVARRVAEEQGVPLGGRVGYSIRFEDVSSSETRLRFLTDGMLLREALLDPDLAKYKVIILDEAHERTLHTDVLLGLLKRLHARRSDLKIVVMSATLDFGQFQTFFPGSKALAVEGRQHKVQTMYLRTPEEDYLDAALLCVTQVHTEEGAGDILLFLTGQEEIENMERLIRQRAAHLPNLLKLQLVPVPLYAALPPDEQLRAFQPAAPGERKVILATNIAETSVTIGGVRFVVDPGLVKMRGYSAKTGVESLVVTAVSQAHARQRTGRAGREGPGKCYRLYTEDTFSHLQPAPVPEIKRCNMASVVLQLKALGIDDVLQFDFMDPPPREAVVRSLELLYALGALDDTGKLSSPLGEQLARFPLEPQAACTLVAATRMGCGEEMLVVLAMLSAENIFYLPREKKAEAIAAHQQFASIDGDHATLSNVFRAYKATPASQRRDWVFDHFVNQRALKRAEDVHQQLRDHVVGMKLPLKSCGDDTAPLRKALVAGYFLNAAQKQPDNTYRCLSNAQAVSLHPTSVLMKHKPDVVLYNELVQTSRLYVRDISRIEIAWLAELAPRFYTGVS